MKVCEQLCVVGQRGAELCLGACGEGGGQEVRAGGVPGLGHTAIPILGEERGSRPTNSGTSKGEVSGDLDLFRKVSGGGAGRPGSCLLSPPLPSILVSPSDATLKRVLPRSGCHSNSVNKEELAVEEPVSPRS